MKKGIIVAVSVLAAIVISLNVFHESIGSFTAKIIYRDTVSQYNISDSSQVINLKKGDYIYFGKYNGKNILWKVVSVSDDGMPVLLSEKVICFMPFNSGRELKADSSNWETSTIRQWLNSTENKSYVFECSSYNKIKNDSITVNGGFLCAENFCENELSALSEGDDKVFLPSRKILSGLAAKERKKAPTADAVINDGSRYIQFRSTCWYWTQTPISTNTSSVTAVTTSGSFYKSISNDALTGVCPALNLKSSSVNICGGKGTLEKPYVFASEVSE